MLTDTEAHVAGVAACVADTEAHAFRDTEAAGAGAAERGTVDETNTETECEPQVMGFEVSFLIKSNH